MMPTTTFNIDGRVYLVQHTLIARLDRSSSSLQARKILCPSGRDFLLATVINWKGASFDEKDFDQIETEFERRDDVWCRSFEEGDLIRLAS